MKRLHREHKYRRRPACTASDAGLSNTDSHFGLCVFQVQSTESYQAHAGSVLIEDVRAYAWSLYSVGFLHGSALARSLRTRLHVSAPDLATCLVASNDADAAATRLFSFMPLLYIHILSSRSLFCHTVAPTATGCLVHMCHSEHEASVWAQVTA